MFIIIRKTRNETAEVHHGQEAVKTMLNIPFMSVDAAMLVTQVLIAAIEVVGIIQWLKNYLPKACKKKTLATLCILFSLFCGFMNSHHISEANTTFFNIVVLTLAVSQLAWTIIANTIPRAVDNLISRKFGLDSPADSKKSTSASK